MELNQKEQQLEKIDLLIPDEDDLSTFERNQIEKELILEEVMSEMGKGKEFSLTALIGSVAFLFTILSIIGMKVHFNNKIYTLSREIASLKHERNFLLEENSVIKMKLEDERYRSEIESQIF
jgi:hypothetical protein